MNVSAEAVEAAHKAWRVQASQPGTIFEYNLRAALEAAAPHLMARAWDDGEAAGYQNAGAEQWGYEQTPNPYRSAGAGE